MSVSPIKKFFLGACLGAAVFSTGRCSVGVPQPTDDELPRVMIQSVKRLHYKGNNEALDSMLHYLARNGYEDSMWESLDDVAKARCTEKGWNTVLGADQKWYLARNLEDRTSTEPLKKTLRYGIDVGRDTFNYLQGNE